MTKKIIKVKASKRSMALWLQRIINDDDVEVNDKWMAKQILEVIVEADNE